MKAYTDLEQNKKLAEILPIESADHHYVRKTCDFRGNPVDGKWSEPKYGNPNSKHANYMVQNFTSYEIIPCWSLAALIEQIPSDLGSAELTIEKNDSEPLKYGLNYHDRWGREDDIQTKYYDNLVDACYEMIIKLHEQKLL